MQVFCVVLLFAVWQEYLSRRWLGRTFGSLWYTHALYFYAED